MERGETGILQLLTFLLMRIVIIGAGAIGRAIEQLLNPDTNQVELWDKDQSKVRNQKALEELVPNAQVIFLCVPSWFLREAVQEVKPFLQSATILVGISKGLEQTSGKRTDEVIQEECPGRAFALLFGPMLAREIQENGRAYAVGAGEPLATQALAELFAGSRLNLSMTPDAASSALAGVLKNVYTILLGAATGFGYGQNVKGFIVAASLREMQIIAKRLGLDPEATLGIAGAADFVATGFSEHSQNFTLGKNIAITGAASLASEGKVSAEALIQLLHSDLQDLPLLKAVGNILSHPAKAKDFFEEIL